MAISQAVAQAILGQKTPDIMGAFEQGQETAFKRQERDRQEKIRELSGMALQGDDESMQELSGIAPELSLRMQKAIGAKDDAALARFIQDAKVGESLLIGGNTQGFLSFADQRIKAIRRMGGDTAQTERMAALVRAGDTDTAIQELTAFSAAIDDAKNMGPTSRQQEWAQFEGMPESTEQERKKKREYGQLVGIYTIKKDRVTPDQLRDEERAKVEGKIEGQINLEGELIAKVKQAEALAKAKGETFTDLAKLESALPFVLESVSELKSLAPIATNTVGGKVWDYAVKQSGFGSTEGANARTGFQSIVSNQILPLLKSTFGAAFTETEGAKLEATLGDVDATPEQKIIALDAYIAQQYRNIKSKKSEVDILGGELSATTQPDSQVGRFNVRAK